MLEDAPGQRYRGLQVELPSSEFADIYQELREALGLLAAVAHVDNAAWKRLLLDYVKLDIDSQEELFEGEFPPRFQLALIGDGPDCDRDLLTGLDEFCGTKQHATYSAAYTKALTRIAAVAGGKACTGSTEIEISVTIQLGPWLTTSSDDMLTYLRGVQQKVRDIRMQWLSYIDKSQAVLSVTFVLEALMTDLRDIEISAELAELVDSLANDGARFTGLALRQELHHSLTYNGYQGAARKTVGQLVWGLFGGTKRLEATAKEEWGGVDFETTTMTGPLASTYGHPNQLALSPVHFDCEAMQNWVFERVCSAVAVNQTTKNLSLALELNDGDDDDDGDWALCRWRWEWIIFACFSEKARLHSRLESLTLRNAVITVEAVEAMAAILASDAPEEALLGCMCCSFDGSTDICIKANSPIKLRPMHADEAYSSTFTVEKELSGVRLLSDPAERDWLGFEDFDTSKLEGIVASCPNLIELAPTIVKFFQ
ncbi:hypothetical protein BBJ29_009231 [Phytophthora kernoviae]|uniref:Uncharacterized protein n=1 Tax=Phytophthora kernoviae TaxID=325452 RepID=A0A3F2RCI5_9STRA|nr:hypothetical protein BBJ29_009231 [Phytophthora kernoviae]RLN52886.1 hypothetical protein BBP00_00009512 [Phytophthora kernoviae]